LKNKIVKKDQIDLLKKPGGMICRAFFELLYKCWNFKTFRKMVVQCEKKKVLYLLKPGYLPEGDISSKSLNNITIKMN